MPTKKNLGLLHIDPTLYVALAALLIALFLRQTNWIWESLYLQRHTATEIILALGSLASLVIAFVALFHWQFGTEKTIKLINFGIVLLLTYFGFHYFKTTGLLPSQSSALHKQLAVATGVIAGLSSLKINSDTWKRMHVAGIVGGLIFFLMPVLIANTKATTIYWPTPSSQTTTDPAVSIPAQNTIVLLLDELSANAAGPIVEQLHLAGLQTDVSYIDPAGENTINVIPAIWARRNFDDAAVCGPTQICSKTNVLDFAKVKPSAKNIDIVGFYHPYCSIQGLRSCYFGHLPSKATVIELACTFPGANKLKFLDCFASDSFRKSYITLRDNLQQSFLEAPFWQKGGILFAHLLVPHPLMGIPEKTLSEEYADNIVHGASFVKQVVTKATSVFGDNYKIIVFSDHPLRTEFWCADKYYIDLKCKPLPEQESTQIPLIIATPLGVKKALPKIKNNQTVFDLLFM